MAYLLMRKCACSSIKHALAKIRDPAFDGQDGLALHGASEFDVLASQFEPVAGWFTFTFVREPIRRFFSFYANKILNQDIHTNHTLANYERFGLLPNMTVDEVIDHLVSEKFETEPHLLVQSTILDAAGVELDFVGRLEQMFEGLAHIHRRTGVSLQLRRLNSAKHKPLLPSFQQFDRLAEYYSADLKRFGYPDNYFEWYVNNVSGREHKFRLEAGYTFGGEAKLLDHRTIRLKTGFLIQLTWRRCPGAQRDRMIRLVRQNESELEIICRLPPKTDFKSGVGASWLVNDHVLVPFEKFKSDEDFSKVFIQIYFVNRNQTESRSYPRARLTDYHGHNNMLLLSMGTAKSEAA